MAEIQEYKPHLPTVPDVPPSQVEWLANIRQHPARAMMAQELETAVTAAFVKSAAYFEPPDAIQQGEFAVLFQEMYPNLNPLECAAALRMNVAGKFGEDDAKQRIFYNNKFNVATMCAILNAYQEWRQKIVAAIVTAEDEARREQERAIRDAAWVEALVVEKAAFLRGEYGVINSFSDIPPYWFDWAIEEKLLTWETGEKHKRIEAARKEAENELNTQNENTRQAGRISEVIKGDQFTQSVELRAKVIQRKRAIWDKLINQPVPSQGAATRGTVTGASAGGQ
jgi:hypothetical protein